jgi:hypothetical protein
LIPLIWGLFDVFVQKLSVSCCVSYFVSCLVEFSLYKQFFDLFSFNLFLFKIESKLIFSSTILSRQLEFFKIWRRKENSWQLFQCQLLTFRIWM